MSDSKALDKLSDLAGTDLPDVFYGRNHVFITLPKNDFLLEICPVDSISLSAYAKREKYLRKEASVTVKSDGDE
jgi:hypothetical protein